MSVRGVLLWVLLASAAAVWLGIGSLRGGEGVGTPDAPDRSVAHAPVLGGRAAGSSPRPAAGAGTLFVGASRVDSEAAARVLEVRVRDRGGNPIPGATVVVTPPSSYGGHEEWRAEGTTDGAGHARLPLRSRGGFVEARATGYPARWVPVLPEEEQATVILVQAAALQGRVLDAATGSPVPGVPVYVIQGRSRLWATRDEDRLRAVSDGSGRYVVEGVAEGDATVFAFGAGWVSEEILRVDCGSTYDPLHVRCDEGVAVERDLPVAPAGRVRGRVTTDGGTALPGARVRACQGSGRRGCGTNRIGEEDYPFVPDPPEVATDAAGAYEVDTLLPGIEYTVSATAEGYGWGSESTVAASGAAATVNLEPAPRPRAWFLEIVVQDAATGSPIAGARIQGASTDARGWARVGPLRGDLRSQTTAEGYFPGDVEVDAPEEPGEREPTRRLPILLERAAHVAGRVERPDGGPAEGARVELAGGSRSTHASEGQGAFALGGLDPAGPPVALRATWEDQGRRYRGEARAPRGASDVVIRLEADPVDPALVPRRVEVCDAAGRTVPSFDVSVWTRDGPEPDVASPWVRGGSFLLVPPRVPFWLEIFESRDASGRPVPAGALPLGPFSTTAEVPARITLPGERRIEGCVRDDAGAPVAGLLLVAVPTRVAWEGLEVDPWRHRSSHAEASTDRAGRFVLDRLGDQPYRVRVQVPHGWRRPEEAVLRPGGPPVEIRVGPAPTRLVTVLDPWGRPIEGALVGFRGRFLPDADGRRTSADGSVHVADPVVAGDRSVPLDLEVDPPSERRRELGSAIVRGWVPADTTVRLPSTSVLEGIVVDEHGHGVAGVDLRARTGEEEGPRGFDRATADAEGRFRFPGLPPGRVVVEVALGSFLRETRVETRIPCDPMRVVVSRGRSVELVLEGPIPSGVPLQVRIAGRTEEEGRGRIYAIPVASARAPILLPHLVPGASYEVLVLARKTGQIAYLPAVAADSGTVRASLMPVCTLRGRVRSPTGGSRLPDVQVEFAVGAFSWSGEGDERGAFVLSGLPAAPGRLRVRVTHEGQSYGAVLPTRSDGEVDVTVAPEDD